ncbi:serine-rich adhesin for platelets [Eurosta solidaginis]|uniref:serine-rich adhesin for platelets n=1 Tax=Eurosta solidaginis TaxID=178769 RepID=UPI003530E1BE
MSCQQQVTQSITPSSVSTEDQDPYVFTETVPTTSPTLFNAQKSRSRVFIEVQTLTPKTPNQTSTALTDNTVANTKRPITTTAAANANKYKLSQKLPLSPLNGNQTKTQAPATLAVATGPHNGSAAAAAATAATMAMGTIAKSTITQSQQQQQQLQQHKKALNVCIVRPQQQLSTTARQQQQQQQQIFKAQQQRKQSSSSPPLLLQHTPSLWQTPLLLDTAASVVSPPTSPASLPSPPLANTEITSPTAVTAMVSPLITTSATTLPPSNFHHNTLAQHLQKVECLKKPKKILDGSTNGKYQEQTAAMLRMQQQQSQSQRREVGAKTVVVQPTTVLQPPQQPPPQQPPQMHKQNVATSSAPPPLQAIQAVTVPQHSDTDLNEIPVNVIFRKPQSSENLNSQLGGNVKLTALGNAAAAVENKANMTAVTSLAPTSFESVKQSLTHIKSKNQRTFIAGKSKKAADVLTEAQPSLHPAPHVLRDIVFTHIGTASNASTTTHTLPAHIQSLPATNNIPNQQQQQNNMSSMAKLPSPAQFAPKLTTASTTTVCLKSMRVAQEKSKQNMPTDTQQSQRVIAAVKVNTMTFAKNVAKRKMSVTATGSATIKSTNTMSPGLKKRSHKIGPLYSASDNEMFLHCATTSRTEESQSSNKNGRKSHAVAVVKMSAAELEADTSLLASSTVLPYCIQKHWLYITREIQLIEGGCGGIGVAGTHVSAAAAAKKGVGNSSTTLLSTSANERETRITQRKTILRRHALQMLATHSLQKLPMQAARRRLMCVDRLLRKYERYGDNEIIAHKKCNYAGCAKTVLEMATQCEDHIVDNISQHIFLPCTAKFADNTQCRIPVFDIIHDLPLCVEHARKRDAYNRAVHGQQRIQTNHKIVSTIVAKTLNKTPADYGNASGDLLTQLQQIKQQPFNSNVACAVISKTKKSSNIKVNATRKRKAPPTTESPNSVGRTIKRPKKMVATLTPTSTPPIVVTTASIVAPLQLTSAVLQRKSSTTSLESIASNSQSSISQPHYISSNMNIQGGQAHIAMPALAPLSGRNMPVVSSSVSPTVVPPKHTLSFGLINANNANGGNALQKGADAISQDLKPHEISQLVAQFSVAVNSKNNGNAHNNINTNAKINTSNTYSNNSITTSLNSYFGTNCDSNFTSALGSSSSLPSSTEELFHQELLSVCENSSAYASSEDTGLGGLSETELMVGPNDADDIPLGDTRLLEEHDLANVLSTLPEDAFNELFTAVHQEEREEVERALELADKHLKSLQQTIGTDIDFLRDFPDDDEILADSNAIVSSVMRSPDATSGIDTSTLFIDSGSNSAGGGDGGGSGANITDIRGLVQA